jgi:hypothetical protein
MYLDIGFDFSVREDCVVGVFDLDNASYSKRTREFLKKAEEDGQIVGATDGLPKSFLLTSEYGQTRVYLAKYNAPVLMKRLINTKESI